MMRALDKVLPWLFYPLVMASAFVAFGLLQRHGVSLQLSTYLPVLMVAVCAILLERRFTYRREWQPDKAAVKTDLLFIVAVQLAFPPLVSLFFVHAMVEPTRALNLPVIHWWPHAASLWLQVILMILTVDLLRYWLHRAAHTYPILWRLHSVHHSVEQLYWLNTSRFHPLEKVLQMSLDSLPFLLMGVDEKVIVLYYLAYASNGFFQHSNIRMRFGVLNYLIGSADLHRWHHSREPSESNANYGNNFIVWDLLFGTWYLPRAREVGALGLRDRDYPKSFLAQMRAPFKR